MDDVGMPWTTPARTGRWPRTPVGRRAGGAGVRAGRAAGPWRHERGVGGGGARRRATGRGQGGARRRSGASRRPPARRRCRPGRLSAHVVRGRGLRRRWPTAGWPWSCRTCSAARSTRLVRARGHLSPGEVVTVLAPVASALGRLHDLGVVHGDVSPGNVLLDLDGRPVLGDLGLGHVVGEVSPGVWGTDGLRRARGAARCRPEAGIRRLLARGAGVALPTGAVPGAARAAARAGRGLAVRAEGPSALVRRARRGACPPTPATGPGPTSWRGCCSGPPRPSRCDLVRGDDEVSAVTYRLRAAAGRPPVAPAARGGARGPAEAGSRLAHGRRDRRRSRALGAWRGPAGRHASAEVRRGWRGSRASPPASWGLPRSAW